MTKTPGDKTMMFEGYWKENSQNGRGRAIWNDGDTYEGGFEKNERSGYGVYRQHSHGTKKIGMWKKNNLDGPGEFHFHEGSKYIGNFRNDKFHGKGTIFDKNGNISMQGKWKNNKF